MSSNCFAANPELLNLQFVLVELVAEEAVLLVKAVDGAAVLRCRLGAVLHLQPEKFYHLVSFTQFQPQCLSFCMQDLALALSVFQPGKVLKKKKN